MAQHLCGWGQCYLEKEIMKINFSINDNNEKDPIVRFFENKINYNFIKMEQFFSSEDLRFLIIKENISENEISTILEKTKESNILFFAHKLIKNLLPPNLKIVFYPIDISLFENNIKKYLEINTFFENIYLTPDSFLINSNNQKKIYLTEKEYEIIILFFREKIVKKNKIHTEVLNLHADIDTKSLDAHLSRIRNKLLKIDSNLAIRTIDQHNLEIKKLL